MSDHTTPPDQTSSPNPAAADAKALTAALSVPFAAHEVKFKPQAVKGNRAMATAYIDARLVQDRLDDVLGVEGWQDEYNLLPDGSVVCKLQLNLGGRWVSKMDVGSPSEQPDGGDRLKAAFSDALKRAAVKFGIGRYLYRLPASWCDYDLVKRQFTSTPQLPAWALPPGDQQSQGRQQTPAAGPQRTQQQKPAKKAEPPKPYESVEDMQARVAKLDAWLVSDRKAQPNLLKAWLVECGKQAGYAAPEEWNNPVALAFGLSAVQQFVAAFIGRPSKVLDAVQVADAEAGKLERKLDEAGRKRFGVKWADWLSEQGIPDPAELSKMNFRSLDAVLSDFNTQVATADEEAKAIADAGAA